MVDILGSEAESEAECGPGLPAVECVVKRMAWGKRA